MAKEEQHIGYDESYYEGDSLQIVVTVTEDGSDKDITGSTPSWTMSSDPGDAVELSDSDSGVSASVTDAANGEVTVTIDEGTTDGKVGKWYHEVRLEDSAGEKSVVTRGRMAIQERVST